MPLNPWLGIAAVLVVFAAMYGLLAVARRYVSGELSRKGLHIGMGLVSTALPWVFDRAWPVLLLAGASAVAMAVVKFWGPARRRIGHVLVEVDRPSLGEVYYPVSVGLLFVLARAADIPQVPHAQKLLFCIPMLILAFGDALAAIIGITYGRHPYTAAEGQKSAEGSIAFFAVAFLATLVPLLLATNDRQVSRDAVLLISITIAFLVMLLEGVAWRGLDNLLVPMGSFILLYLYLQMNARQVAVRLIVAFGWVLLMLLWRRRSSLNDAALMAAALFGYVISAIGGARWAVAPLALFIAYNRIWPRNEIDARRGHSVDGVIGTNLPGVVWLLIGAYLRRPELLGAFAVTYAAHLAIIGLMRVKHARPAMGNGRVLALVTVLGWLAVMGPVVGACRAYRWDAAIDRALLVQALLAPSGVLFAAGVFLWTQPAPQALPSDRGRWWRQGLLAFAGSGIVVLAARWW